MLLPALARAKERAKRIVCLNNEKQLVLALNMYAGQFKDKLPDNLKKGYWAWDMRQGIGDIMEENGVKYKTWYCPALGPDFNDGDFLALWNWEVVSPPPDDPTKEGARVLGYAQTFPNTVSLDPTNYNVSLVQPPTIQIGFGVYKTESLADRVLFADVVMTQSGQNNVAQRGTYQY